MKRNALVLLMLMLLCLLLTGCYQEVDPWPASTPAVTEAPPAILCTQPVTMAPTQDTSVENFWMEEQPTQVPGGEVDPGFNG